MLIGKYKMKLLINTSLAVFVSLQSLCNVTDSVQSNQNSVKLENKIEYLKKKLPQERISIDSSTWFFNFPAYSIPGFRLPRLPVAHGRAWLLGFFFYFDRCPGRFRKPD